jgi:hypothetical protein
MAATTPNFVIASVAKQSRASRAIALDCFVAARLAMTKEGGE